MEARFAVGEADGEDGRGEGGGLFAGLQSGAEDADLRVVHFDFVGGFAEFGGSGPRGIVVEFDLDDFERGAADVFTGVETDARIPADLAGGEGDVAGGFGFEVGDALGAAVEVDHHAVDLVDMGAGELAGDGGAHDDADPLVFEQERILGEGGEGEEEEGGESAHWGNLSQSPGAGFDTLTPMRLALTILAAVLTVHAQTNTGTITGLVIDSGGAVVPGAKVAIREVSTNATVNTVTTEAGSYTVPSLPIGSYEVTVSAAGFKRGSATGLAVRATQTTTQNFTLEIGDVTESVTVSADASLVNPNSSAVTTSVGEKMLDDLPFMDRSTLSVVLLAPGAQGDPQYNGGVQSDLPGVFTQAVAPGASISIGGGIPGGGSTLVDGSDVTAAGNGRMITTFSRDQVSEVSVQANGIPAQYGRTTSAIINQATRSGGNQFHGNASWSHLDPYLQTQALGAAFPPTQHYDQAAVAVGGPVVLPKL